MGSPAYKASMDYAIDVLRAVKESGCDMDYPLEQFVNVSVRIGAALVSVETPVGQKEMQEAYKEANMNACRSIYWCDILGRLDYYKQIPFETLRKKCEDLQSMLSDGVKLMGRLTGYGF